MSLINDMLRDLETRRSDELRRQNLQGEIRPLPALQTRSRGIWLALVGLALLLLTGLLIWHFASRKEVRPPTPAAMPPLVATPVAVPSQAATTQAPTLPPAPAATQPPATQLALAPTHAKPSEPSLSMSADLSPLPPGTSAKPATRPATVKAAAPSVTAILPAQAAKPKANEATPPPTPAKIEVSSASATPRERADADLRAAQGLNSAGRPAEAIDALRTALRHDAEFAPARQLLVRLLLGQGRLDEAMAVLAEGLEHQPGQIGWAMSLARIQVEKKDVAAAGRTLTKFSGQAAGNAEYAGFHAHVHYLLGHHGEAVTHYKNATRLAPAEGRWWYGLGVALDALGRDEEANNAFRQALATGTLNAELTAQAKQHLH